ncbi:hypothetical protein Bbelb_002520 [Branchiostoma belcheri]|nr:hypothetical protein Bbelb_002520 [Branchiostoma belcheri]
MASTSQIKSDAVIDDTGRLVPIHAPLRGDEVGPAAFADLVTSPCWIQKLQEFFIMQCRLVVVGCHNQLHEASGCDDSVFEPLAKGRSREGHKSRQFGLACRLAEDWCRETAAILNAGRSRGETEIEQPYGDQHMFASAVAPVIHQSLVLSAWVIKRRDGVGFSFASLHV